MFHPITCLGTSLRYAGKRPLLLSLACFFFWRFLKVINKVRVVEHCDGKIQSQCCRIIRELGPAPLPDSSSSSARLSRNSYPRADTIGHLSSLRKAGLNPRHGNGAVGGRIENSTLVASATPLHLCHPLSGYSRNQGPGSSYSMFCVAW